MKKILIVILIIVLVGLGVWGYSYYWKPKPEKTSDITQTNTPTTTQTFPSAEAPVDVKTLLDKSGGKPTLSIPQEILANKFGFLGAGPDSQDQIIARGAAWIRPHPGPFLWDAMQKSQESEIDFANADKEIQDAQVTQIGILATLWPFAEWDQQNRSDVAHCKVSSNDEFLKRQSKGKDGDFAYLPEHRCNPHDWDAYQKWLTAVVERYDGDGIEDMTGLKIPLKYWEIMNEPDLGISDRLTFYQEDEEAYAALLIKTSQAIRQADPEAKILIAGAAGGNNQFLEFYRKVFANKDTYSAFDIGNVHCISNDNYDSFNVEPYKKMLAEFGLDSKPIWVTEAEAMVSSDADTNATQVLHSTKKALSLGAARIFYTMYDFTTPAGGGMKKPLANVNITPELDGSNAENAYQTITSQK